MTSAARSLALTLALCAMVLRALLPAGWMPNVTGAPGAPLVICTMDGLHHVPADHDPSHSSGDEHSLCPFAAAAHLAPPLAAPAVSLPIAIAWAAVPSAKAAQASFTHDPAHAPRGPPLPV